MRAKQDPPREVNKRKDESTFEVQPGVTTRRESDDDALAETSPTDSRADEKVIVNGDRDQVVNTPARSAINEENE